MNLPLIHDALGILRLQFKPLTHYQYPTRHVALALLLLGIVTAAGAPRDMGEPLNVILFFTAYVSLETLLYGQFMQWWLRRAGADSPPLTGTIIAASAIQVLDPLSSWLPQDASTFISMVLGLFGLWLLVSVLSFGSGVSKMRVMLGTFLFAPLALLLSVQMMHGASNLGLISMPQELQQALEQQDKPDNSAKTQGSSSAGDTKL